MKSTRRPIYRMHGLSLVELMVAMTIGLIILAAVSSLFVSSKRTYTTQDSLARLQENARFAMQFLSKDIRLAGYYGCLYDAGINPTAIPSDGSVGTATMKFNLNGGVTFATNVFAPVEGLENAAGTWLPSANATLPANIKSGTDAITVRMTDLTATTTIAPGMLNGSSILNVTSDSLFNTNDIVVVSDCEKGDVMKVTGKGGNALQHATGGTANVTLNLTKAYTPPASVSKLVTRQYYIGTKIVNGKTVPGLYVADGSGAVGQELVEGIENMQIMYGKDTDMDKVPNIYLKAGDVGMQSPADWYSVVTVRIGILARTIDDKNTDVDNNTYDVDGDGINEVAAPGDHYRRRVFQTVIKLRDAWAF